MAKKVTKKKAPTKKKTTTRKPRRTTSKVKKAVATPVTPATEEQIRLRAFEIYRSGRNHNPDADWLQAERELQTELTT